MISLDGDPEVFLSPHLFEASDINKINGTYYFSYVLNSSATGGLYNTQIAYRTATDPMGEFGNPVGIMRAANTQLSSDDNNNHHCIFKFQDNYYIAYHASRVKYAMGANKNGGYYRSSHIDNITVNPTTGVISTVTMTSQGVEQVGNFDPYVQNEAETIGIMGGIFTRADAGASNGMVVTAIDSGDWVALYGVDFGSAGAKSFTAKVRTSETPGYVGAIELRLDPKKAGNATGINNITATNTARIEGGEVIGRLVIEALSGQEGKYTTVTIDLDKTVTGVHDLVFVFYTSSGANPITPANLKASKHKDSFEFDQWQFFN
jgi:arabinoxylan arabinofuranohydrolase